MPTFLKEIPGPSEPKPHAEVLISLIQGQSLNKIAHGSSRLDFRILFYQVL